MKKSILLALLLSTMVWALPAGIEIAIAKSHIPKNDISLYIKEAGKDGRIIAALHENKMRTPASVIKVLTIYAAILKLGFDYRWPTRFYSTGKIKQGILYGDIIVKGYGDPTLSDKDLPDIISRIKAMGIRSIHGNIVIDRSYFRVGSRNTSGFDNHPHSPYNAMPDAMMFNERVSTICVVPNQNSVTKKVPDSSYVIHNQLQRVNRPCRGRYSWPRVKIDDSKAVPEVWLKGKISKHCGKRNICQVLTKSYKSFYYALRAALDDAGVPITGTLRLRQVPKDAKILFTHYSEPLENIVSVTAKKSNNLYARHLLLLLGAKMYGAPATIEKGRRAVRVILKARGVLKHVIPHIDNGCGLSRESKLSARVLADVLDDAYERYGMRWMKILSIAGVDGTIKRRFRGTVVQNRAWMKTGTLKYAKNIAGYVKSRSGRYYTVVILVNTHRGNWRAAALENNIIKWMVTYRSGSSRVSEPKSVSGSRKEVNNNTLTSHMSIDAAKEAYYIQTGSFSHKPTGFYLNTLREMGFSYNVIHEANYKVLVGPYTTETTARNALDTIRKHLNRGAFLVRHAVLASNNLSHM